MKRIMLLLFWIVTYQKWGVVYDPIWIGSFRTASVAEESAEKRFDTKLKATRFIEKGKLDKKTWGYQLYECREIWP